MVLIEEHQRTAGTTGYRATVLYVYMPKPNYLIRIHDSLLH
jgi:hypothetical protein